MSYTVFDSPNQVWEVKGGVARVIGSCDFKSIKNDAQLVKFFKPFDKGDSLLIVDNYGHDGSFLKEHFQHGRLIKLVADPSKKGHSTFEERLIYSINNK